MKNPESYSQFRVWVANKALKIKTPGVSEVAYLLRQVEYEGPEEILTAAFWAWHDYQTSKDTCSFEEWWEEFGVCQMHDALINALIHSAEDETQLSKLILDVL